MKIEDDDDDSLALKARLGIGDDTPPLMTIVGEPAPSHWGKITSKTSSEYLDFLKRNRERNGK
jgi:hypothetical protein